MYIVWRRSRTSDDDQLERYRLSQSEADRISNKAELETSSESDSDSSSSGMEDGFRTDVLAPAVLLLSPIWQAQCLLSQLPTEPSI